MKPHEKIHWTHFAYWILVGVVVIISFNYMYLIFAEANAMNTFRPDVKISYYKEFNTTNCEINAGHWARQDFYDICPYVIKMLGDINEGK